MPDDVSAATGGIPAAFKQRIGPLPLWGWGLGLGGAVVGFVMLKRRGGGAQLSGGDIPATIGSGGGGSSGGGSGIVNPPSSGPIDPPITPVVGPCGAGSILIKVGDDSDAHCHQFSELARRRDVNPNGVWNPGGPAAGQNAHWEQYPDGNGQWVWSNAAATSTVQTAEMTPSGMSIGSSAFDRVGSTPAAVISKDGQQ